MQNLVTNNSFFSEEGIEAPSTVTRNQWRRRWLHESARYLVGLSTVPPPIIDDVGLRKLAHTAAEELLELINCPRRQASTLSFQPGQ